MPDIFPLWVGRCVNLANPGELGVGDCSRVSISKLVEVPCDILHGELSWIRGREASDFQAPQPLDGEPLPSTGSIFNCSSHILSRLKIAVPSNSWFQVLRGQWRPECINPPLSLQLTQGSGKVISKIYELTPKHPHLGFTFDSYNEKIIQV